MKAFVLPNTNQFLHMMNMGWGNGYVAIPPGSRWFGVDYDDIPVEVHGGLTYSDYADSLRNLPEHIPGDYWVIGFDTCHFGDNLETWPKERVKEETINLLNQMKRLEEPV